MKVNLAEIRGAFHLPRPNWDVIRSWVERHLPEAEREQAWGDAVEQWLEALNQALGGVYRSVRGEDLILFAPQDYPQAESLLHSAESSLATIVDLLGDVASENWRGPLVLLLFKDLETYYTYLSLFYSAGEWGGSSGVCLRSEGYLHIAFGPGHWDELQRTAAHEITHACLTHLKLPQWLEEGITQHLEGALHGGHTLAFQAGEAERAKRYWRENGLQAFWWGKGFKLPDEGQSSSYFLARVLFYFLSVDYQRQFRDFLRHAHANDAGEGAARAHLGKGLVDLATQFLGPGPWEPVPPDAAAYYRRATLYAFLKQHDRAIADCDKALGLVPPYADAYRARGYSRDRLGQYALARTDYAQAIQFNPKDSSALNNLAWLLATCPEEEHRDGEQALEHAHKACELTGYEEWYCLGTLAAACAEANDFEEAVHWAKEALRRAPEAKKADSKERLKLYKEGMPYRDERASTE